MVEARDSQVVNELIAACVDGARFYETAAREVEDSELRLLFREMASTRETIAEALAHKLQELGHEPDVSGTLTGRMKQFYTELRARLAENGDQRYIADLETLEASALNDFKLSTHKVESRRVAQELANHLATIQLSHDQLKALKQTRLDRI
ncbi:PA2169 family four-helix-bundle protein [Marinobacterium mangrovicola]|uniref:Uncharacterized protein (TIGR02284 family) n=1 Tax=Marinobacterium mangrovicola TaxID=1476959 RepID=A0A4R1GR32_9GAMM|nr:PA2169 family four-helix-bundle protein [Marinobacterium mangrovicola]TCK09535.1 uncharacterized protein (TIGR02284 family) [Marinobacterium mangrovicola]